METNDLPPLQAHVRAVDAHGECDQFCTQDVGAQRRCSQQPDLKSCVTSLGSPPALLRPLHRPEVVPCQLGVLLGATARHCKDRFRRRTGGQARRPGR